MLCDLGADIIKIEPPAGDLTRFSSPRRNGLSSYFVQQNTGWISERLRCPVCMGADGSLVAIFMLRDFTLDWDAVPLLGASIGAHLVYQTILKKGDRNGY